MSARLRLRRGCRLRPRCSSCATRRRRGWTSRLPNGCKGHMTDTDIVAAEPGLSFREFLEGIHPSVQKNIKNLWLKYDRGGRMLSTPPLRLHCDKCDGERWFRSSDRLWLNN